MLNELNNKGKTFDLLIGDSQWIGAGAVYGHYVKLNDFFDKEFNASTDVIIFKNFSNKKISKMNFEEKFIHLLNTCKNSSQVSRVYMLTGSPVLNLSKTFLNMYNININKIISPYFDTHRYIAEIKL